MITGTIGDNCINGPLVFQSFYAALDEAISASKELEYSNSLVPVCCCNMAGVST